MNTERLLEISDLIVSFAGETPSRQDVAKSDVVARLRDVGDWRGAQIVERMPAANGILDAEYVDQLLVRVHREMQRLSEEFQHGQRVLELIVPLFQALKRNGIRPPYRLVDIGCGTGYVIRWLATYGNLTEVELHGVDFNGALIGEAQRLARIERLTCHFSVVDAFDMDQPATLYISTGLLHHFRGDDSLSHFFLQHDRTGTQAFLHFDFQPTILARPGAWLFHYVRMREPLARHDGVISARRVHSARMLLATSRKTSFACGMYSTRVWKLPIPRVFHTLVGIRPVLIEDFRAALGSRLHRLEELR